MMKSKMQTMPFIVLWWKFLFIGWFVVCDLIKSVNDDTIYKQLNKISSKNKR